MFTRKSARYPPDFKPMGDLTNQQMDDGHADKYGQATDKALVSIVTRHAGAAGQGALAELQRRHADAMRRSSRAALWLALVVAVLVVVQIVLAINTA